MKQVLVFATLLILSWPAPAAEQTRSSFTGIVSAVDEKASVVTVKGATASRAFAVSSDTAIVTLGNTNAALRDLEVGDRVSVTFTDENGKVTARRIECTSKGEM